MDLLYRVGGNIKKYREIKSITQQELADICGLHRNYISSVERGRRNISLLSLQKIASGLNIDILKLLQ